MRIGALAVVVLLGCVDGGEAERGGEESRHVHQAVKLESPDRARKDRFGFAVAVSGATIVVGAPEHDGGVANAGAAYVFETGTEVVKLTADDRQAQARFGWSVGISSGTIVVGAFHDDDRGAAYVFERLGGIWQQTAKLGAADGASGDRFGYFVSTTGETAVIGAIWDDDNGRDTGSAYVFEKRGGVWAQTAKLIGDGGSDKSFGRRLSLSGDTLVIGSGSDLRGVDAGTAYVFEKVGGAWTKAATLAPADVKAGDEFGWSVAVSGTTLVASAELDDDHGVDAGSAYVFEKVDGAWTQVAKLVGAEGAPGDQFGQSVSISGDTIVIGAQFGERKPGTRSGLAYTFERRSGVWTQTGKLLPLDGADGDEFGFSSSINGAAVVIGAPRDDHPATDSGSAYSFDLSVRDPPVDDVGSMTTVGSPLSKTVLAESS